MYWPIDVLIGRLLEHVPPRGYQAVRGYGLYCGNQHSQLAAARLALGVPEAKAEEPCEPLNWQQWCEQAGLVESCRCPKCGATLVSHCYFEPGRAPPLWRLTARSVKEAA